MKSVAELVSDLKGKKGVSESVTFGIHTTDVERIPSGVFPFDLAVGGGWPRGRLSICAGKPSCGKTNLILRTIALFQQLYPEEQVVFFDLENGLDETWARRFGIDTERLAYVTPRYGEEAVDLALQLLDAEDLGLMVVDSLANLIPMREIESSAEKMTVGGNSLLVGQLIRRATLKMMDAMKEGRYPTVIGINQIRFKIGAYGDPETMPGGMQLAHASGLTVGVYGKDIYDKEVHKTLPLGKETSITLKKWKVPIVSRSCKYNMHLIPHGDLQVGYVDDWNTVNARLKDLGWLTGKTGSWNCLGTSYATLGELRQAIYGDPEVEQGLKQKIIQAAVKETYGDGFAE